MSPSQVLLILWRRLWVVALTFASTLVGAGGVVMLVPPRYDAVATASIDPGAGDPITGQMVGGSLVNILQGNLTALAKSQRVALDVVKRLNIAANPESVALYQASGAAGRVEMDAWLAAELDRNVDAKFAAGANVLSITYRSNSPVEGALLANSFMSAFIDAAVEMKTASAQQTAQWFAPQMDKLRADLTSARDNLAQFERASNLLAPNASGDSDNSQLMAAANELSTARAELAALESRRKSRAEGDIAEAPAGANEATDTDVQVLVSLKHRVTEVTTDIGKLQAELGANNPKLTAQVAALASLRQQVRDQTALIAGKLAARIEEKKSEVAALDASLARAQEKMIGMQAQRDRLAAMTREVASRQDQLDAASKAAGDARLRSQLSFSNIARIDEATPPADPAFPKPLLVAIAGVGLGLALGFILALLAESLDRRVRVLADLEFATSAGVLGTLAPAAVSNWPRWPRIGRRGGELARQPA